MKKLVSAATLCFIMLSQAQPIDYSMNGKNWVTGMCSTGLNQSPINIDTHNISQNSNANFVINFALIDNATLTISPDASYLGVDVSSFTRTNTLDFWNEKGEHFLYFLNSFQWKTPSEHTIDNRQYTAEL